MAKEMIVIIVNASIEEEMMESLKAAGMEYFTKIPCVHGSGEYSEPRLNSHVWPGTNTLFMICAEAGSAAPLLEAVSQMKERHRKEGVHAFVIPITQTI